MHPIDRLMTYLEQKKVSSSVFEKNCKVANGYLKKQQKGKGSIGSDILRRIHALYPDLNLIWLITGEEEMLQLNQEQPAKTIAQEPREYYTKDERIQFLIEQVSLLESSLSDKNKIIEMLEMGIKKTN
jgi:hypothetical protein